MLGRLTATIAILTFAALLGAGQAAHAGPVLDVHGVPGEQTRELATLSVPFNDHDEHAAVADHTAHLAHLLIVLDHHFGWIGPSWRFTTDVGPDLDASRSFDTSDTSPPRAAKVPEPSILLLIGAGLLLLGMVRGLRATWTPSGHARHPPARLPAKPAASRA